MSSTTGPGERAPLLPPDPRKQHHNLAGYSPTRFRLTALSIWCCTFLAAFDSTVLATLTSTISSSFSAANQGSWLGTAYLLSVCCFTPIYGRLADILSRRWAHLIGMVFFTIGTIMCAVAPSMGWLIAARLVAGIGGGGVQSMAVIIMTDLVDLRYRGLFQGYANIIFGLGNALGGPIGGWISDTFGWRWAFGCQIPALVFGMIIVWVCLTGDLGGVEARQKEMSKGQTSTWRSRLRQIDYLGSFTLVVAVGSLILGLSIKTSSLTTSGSEYTWSDPFILSLLILSGIFAGLFVLVEARYSPMPILPLSLISRRTPAAVAFSLFIIAANQFSLLYNVPLFFTAVRLDPASIAGAHLLPYSLMAGIGSVTVGYIIRRTGRYWWTCTISAMLVLLSAVLLCLWNEESPAWITWIAQIPAGFGYTGVLTATLVALMTDVQIEGKGEVAVATSMSYLFRTTGQVLGVSLSSALIQSILRTNLPRRITGPDATGIITRIRRDTESIRYLPPAERAAAVASYSLALRWVWVVNVGLALLGVVGVWMIREEEIPESGGKVGERGLRQDEAGHGEAEGG